MHPSHIGRLPAKKGCQILKYFLKKVEFLPIFGVWNIKIAAKRTASRSSL